MRYLLRREGFTLTCVNQENVRSGALLSSSSLICSSSAGSVKLEHGLKLGCWFETQSLFMFTALGRSLGKCRSEESPGAAAAPERPRASVLQLGCWLCLIWKKATLRKNFLLKLFPFSSGSRHFCSSYTWAVFCWLKVEQWFLTIWTHFIFLLLDLVHFFLNQNIHVYFLLGFSRSSPRGINSDKALNISMFLMAEVLIASLSNHGLVFSSSLLLLFLFYASIFSIILWKLSCRKGRMRKVTTARGRGEAFSALFQHFGVWLLGESCGHFFFWVMGWPSLAKAEPQEPAQQMGLLARSYSQKSFFLVAYFDKQWQVCLDSLCSSHLSPWDRWCWALFWFLSGRSLWVWKMNRTWHHCLCYFCLLMPVPDIPVSLVDQKESQPASGLFQPNSFRILEVHVEEMCEPFVLLFFVTPARHPQTCW